MFVSKETVNCSAINKTQYILKRYIEVIFDNSGSMQSKIGNAYKYDLAKEIFRETVLPFLNDGTDDFGLRLLRDGCYGLSQNVRCSSKIELCNEIISINRFDNSTPLYATIKDSVEYCSIISSTYDEIHLFVLTDGEDNCDQALSDIFKKDALKNLNINLDLLLVQFGVGSKIQSNNLTAFSNYIGAKTIQVTSEDLRNINFAKSSMKKELEKSTLNNTYQLPHCFDSDTNQVQLNWDEIEKLGLSRFWASILFEEKFISWNPVERNSIFEFEYNELQFLCSLRFKSNIPRELIVNMLQQLISPYYYCLDEIYWDFNAAKWKYFEKPIETEIIDNPDRFDEENLYQNDRFFQLDRDQSQIFRPGACYEVIKSDNNIGINYSLQPTDIQIGNMKQLHEGDFIQFNEKRKPGRPSKTH
jgi:hypothetical protein